MDLDLLTQYKTYKENGLVSLTRVENGRGVELKYQHFDPRTAQKQHALNLDVSARLVEELITELQTKQAAELAALEELLEDINGIR